MHHHAKYPLRISIAHWAVLLAILFCSATAASASIPGAINLQGLLKDGSGNPVVDGAYIVTFTMYDAASGGTQLWSEAQGVYTVSGLFAVLLGASTPVPDSVFRSTSVYLGVSVNGDPEFTPRQQMVSVGYSYRVNSVDSAQGGHIISKVSIGPGHTNTGANAFVAGLDNQVTGEGTAIGGGRQNVASADWAAVAGGQFNTASGGVSAVGGGGQNAATATYAVVGGGNANQATGDASTVGGGYFNTASGIFAAVAGGASNTAAGSFSFAAGNDAHAEHGGCFVWSDGSVGGDFTSTGIRQFLISASGGVGIGTNSPQENLSVNGGMNIDRANANDGLGTAGAPALRFGSASGEAIASKRTAGGNQFGMDFYTNFANRMSINNAGSVGIGITSPAALLHVNGSAGNNTGVWSNLSDRRLKREIEPLSSALETLNRLQPVSFRWRDAKKDAEFGRVRGLIAQDVEQVIPEWVKTDPDGYKRIEPIGVDALLIEAIKELDQKTAEVADLKARLAKLEDAVARMAAADVPGPVIGQSVESPSR